MKHWLAAAAAAPLLIACASAGAQTTAMDSAERHVLIVNGERFMLDDARDAASAIEHALAGDDSAHRVVVEFDTGSSMGWRTGDREAFARAMAELADAFSEGFEDGFDFDFSFDVDSDDDPVSLSDEDGERIDVMVRRVERDAQRRAEHVERQAERMAMRIERHAARAELHGLRAGVAGMEEGLTSIEEVLERGWYEDWSDGERERVALTEERRAELERTRAELEHGLERLRVDLADAEARHAGDGRREVRVVRRDGEVRGWIDGEEATGSDLDRLLEGAPDAPEPPETPDKR